MAVYTIEDSLGRVHKMEADDGLSDENVLTIFNGMFEEKSPRRLNTASQSFGRGIDTVQLGAANVLEGAGRMLEDRDWNSDSDVLDAIANWAKETGGSYREEQIQELQRTQAGVVTVKDIQEAEGLIEKMKLVPSLATQSIAEQAPLFAGLIGATALGSVIPIPGAGIGMGAALYSAMMYGENIEAQRVAVERGLLTELDDVKALKYAPLQAALGLIADRFILAGLMPKGVTKFLGVGTKGLAGKGNLFTKVRPVAKHGLKGALVETPTEIGEAVLSRLQANLPIDDEEAMEEYLEVGVKAGIVGAGYRSVLGPIGVGRESRRQKEIEDEIMAQTAGKRGLELFEKSQKQIAALEEQLETAPQEEQAAIKQEIADRKRQLDVDAAGVKRLVALEKQLETAPQEEQAAIEQEITDLKAAYKRRLDIFKDATEGGEDLRTQLEFELTGGRYQQELDFGDPTAPVQTPSFEAERPLQTPLFEAERPLQTFFSNKVSDKTVADLEDKGLTPEDIRKYGSSKVVNKLDKDGFVTVSQARQVLRNKKNAIPAPPVPAPAVPVATEAEQQELPFGEQQELPGFQRPDPAPTVTPEVEVEVETEEAPVEQLRLDLEPTREAEFNLIDQTLTDQDNTLVNTEQEYQSAQNNLEAQRGTASPQEVITLEENIIEKRRLRDAARDAKNITESERVWRRASDVLTRAVASYNDNADRLRVKTAELSQRSVRSEYEYVAYEKLIANQRSSRHQTVRALKDVVALSRAFGMNQNRLQLKLQNLGLDPVLISDPSTFGMNTEARAAESKKYTAASVQEIRSILGSRFPTLVKANGIQVMESLEDAARDGIIPEKQLLPNSPGFYRDGVIYILANRVSRGSEDLAVYDVAGREFTNFQRPVDQTNATKIYKKGIGIDTTNLKVNDPDIVLHHLMRAAQINTVKRRAVEATVLEKALRQHTGVNSQDGMSLQAVLDYLQGLYKTGDETAQRLVRQYVNHLEANDILVYVVPPNQVAEDVLPKTFSDRAKVREEWDKISRGDAVAATIGVDAQSGIVLLRGTGFDDNIGSGIEPSTIVHEAHHVATMGKILDATIGRGFALYQSLFRAYRDHVESGAVSEATRPLLNFLRAAGVATKSGTKFKIANAPTMEELEADRARVTEGAEDGDTGVWTYSDEHAIKIFNKLRGMKADKRALITSLSNEELTYMIATHQLYKTYKSVKKSPKAKARLYGLVNLHEFAVEILNNSAFRRAVREELPNQWGKIKKHTGSIHDVPTSAITEVMDVATVLAEGPTPTTADIVATAAAGGIGLQPSEQPAGEAGRFFSKVWNTLRTQLRGKKVSLDTLTSRAGTVLVNGGEGNQFTTPDADPQTANDIFQNASANAVANRLFWGATADTTHAVGEVAAASKNKILDLGQWTKDSLLNVRRGGWPTAFMYAQLSLDHLSDSVRRWSPSLANAIDAVKRAVTNRRATMEAIRRTFTEAVEKAEALIEIERARPDGAKTIEAFYDLAHRSSAEDKDGKRHDFRVYFRQREGQSLSSEDQRVLNSAPYKEFLTYSEELKEFYKIIVDVYERMGNRYLAGAIGTIFDNAIELRDIETQKRIAATGKTLEERNNAKKELQRLEEVVSNKRSKMDALLFRNPITNTLELKTTVTDALLEEVLDVAGIKRITPFIPFVRDGDYWIRVEPKPGQSEDEAAVYARRTRGAAARLARERIAKGEKLQVVPGLEKLKNGLQYVGVRGDPERAGQKEARTAIGKLMEKMTTMGYTTEEVQKPLRDLFLDTFSGDSLMQQRQTRRDVPGYEQDILKNLGTMGMKYANAIATMENANDYNAAYGSVEAHKGDGKGIDPRLKAVIQTMKSRDKFMRDPNPNRAAAILSYGGFFAYILFNVSSAVVNLTQLPLMAFGLLGGEYGYAKSANMLVAAMRMYASGGRDNNTSLSLAGVSLADWTLFAGNNLNQKSLTKRFGKDKSGKPRVTVAEMEELRDLAIERSQLRRSSAQELQDIRRQSITGFTNFYAKFELAGGWLFQNSERLNHEVALVASYLLAKNKYKDATPLQHRNRAMISVEEINGPSLAETGPAWMMDGWGKIIGTFKKYAWHMAWSQVKIARNAFQQLDAVDQSLTTAQKDAQGNIMEGALPEGMPTAKEMAKRQFLGIMLPAFLFAGAHGLPYYGAAQMLHTLLKDDDDDLPFDMLVRQTVGDIGFNGPLSHLTGASITSRTGFYGHTPFERPVGGDYRAGQVGTMAYLLESFFGPVYSATVGNVDRALDIWRQDGPDSTVRGISAAIPAAYRNMLKAYEMATKGVRNRRGVLVAETDAWDVLMQISGFVPMDVRTARDENRFMHDTFRRIRDKRSRLAENLFAAQRSYDTREVNKTMKEIRTFNRNKEVRALGQGWSPSQLAKSMQRRWKHVVEHEAVANSSSLSTADITRYYRHYGK